MIRLKKLSFETSVYCMCVTTIGSECRPQNYDQWIQDDRNCYFPLLLVPCTVVHCTQQCSCYINTAIGQTVHWKKKKLGYKIIYCTDILKYYCAVLHNCNSFMKIGGTVQGCYEPYRRYKGVMNPIGKGKHWWLKRCDSGKTEK